MDDVIMDRRTEEAPAQDARLKVRKKKKKRVNSSFLNYLFNLFACCLITVSFLGMDFVLFASSGPINVFSGSSLRPEVLYLLIGIAAAVLAVYFCLSFLSIILYLLTGLATGFCTYAMVNQFANFNTDGTVGSSGTFGAVAVGVQAQKRRAAREQHADHVLLLPAGEDSLSCAEALLIRAEATQHIFARCFVHACKQRGIAAVHRFPSRKACCFTGAAQPLTYCIIIYQRGKKVNDNFAKKSDKKACDPCKKASALFGGCFVLCLARIVVKHLRNGR